MSQTLLTLKQYIANFYGAQDGAQANFAKAVGVAPQQVTKWINSGFNVSVSDDNHQLQSPKREIPVVIEAYNAFSESLDELDDYPLFRHYDGQYMPQPAFITLDIRTGAIDANYSSEIGNTVPIDVFHGLVLRFKLSSSLIHKDAISDFIDENLSKFQRILSVLKADWHNSNYVGRYIEGFEDSEIILDMEHYVECKLCESDEYKLTSSNDIDFDDSILDTPLSRIGELSERVSEYCSDVVLVGVTEDDVMYAAIEFLAEQLYANETLPPIEAKELHRAVVEDDFDIGAWGDELEAALQQDD